MTIAGSDYVLDFTALPDESPWVESGWSNIDYTFAVTGGGLRASGFASASAKYTTVAAANTVSAEFTVATNPASSFDPVGVGVFVDSGAHAGKGFILRSDGGLAIVSRRDAATGTGSSISSGLTISSPVVSDEYRLEYDQDTGDLRAYRNNTSIWSGNDTTYLGQDFCLGVFAQPDNNNGRRLGAIGINGISTGPTLTSLTDPITGSVSGTTNQSTTATAFRITAGGVSVTQALDGSPVTGTSFGIASFDRGNLPDLASVADTGAQALVELMNGETVVASDSVDLGAIPGTTAFVVASPNLVDTYSIFNPLYCDTTPVDGDQFWIITAAGVSANAAGEITGNGTFTVQAWDQSTGLRGNIASYGISRNVIKIRFPKGEVVTITSPAGISL